MFDKSIMEGSKPILVKSGDPFLTDIFIKDMKIIHKDKKCKIVYNGEDFISELNRGSLFGSDSKLIILRSLSDDSVKLIAPLLDYKSQDVIAFIEQSTLRKIKAYQKIKSECSFLKLEPLPDHLCKKWLSKYAYEQGLKFSVDTPGYIIERCGTDLSTLAHEIKKLKLLSNGKDVTEEMCAEILSISLNFNNFEFVDNFVHKRVFKVLSEFNKIDENQYTSMIHFLLNYLSKLYRVAIYRYQKRNSQEISDIIGIPKFIVQTKYLTALSKFPKSNILKAIDLLNDLDLKIRLSKWNRRDIFEIYLLKIMKI